MDTEPTIKTQQELAQEPRSNSKQEQKPKQKSGLSRIFELAHKRRGLILASGVLSSLAALCSFVPFVAVFLVLREVIAVYPDFTLLDGPKVMGYGWLAFGGLAANVVCYLSASLCAHVAAFDTLYDTKAAFMEHVTKIPLGYHITIGSGRLRKIMDDDIEKMETFIAHQFPDLVASVTAPVFMLVLLFVFDWRFGLCALVAVLLAFMVQFSLMGKDSALLSAKLQETQADMASASVEYVRGMPVLKGFGQTERSFKRLYQSIKAYSGFMLEYTFKWRNGTCAFNAIINNVYLVLLPVGILIGMNTGDYAGYAMSFIFYLLFVPSISSTLSKVVYVSSGLMRISNGVAALDAIFAIPEISQEDRRQLGGEVSSGHKLKSHDIAFNQVSFSYANDQGERVPALQKVSFLAPEGKLTAIVGPSGGGKSTIAHLIPRFWDVEEGSISLGGTDIRGFALEELMDQVSFVFQDSSLFKQSVKENIRMDCKQLGDNEIISAAKKAQCHDFIMALPEGYDTLVGAEGTHFSGGEKQRIAIARAIAKDAPVIVLDEATAFADPENEYLIQQALSELTKNKTVIMIAHRLSTIRQADSIVVVDEGRVAQQGTHDELIRSGGLYAQLWKAYTASVGWKITRRNKMENQEVSHG